MKDIFDRGEIRGKLHATDWLKDIVYTQGDGDVVQVQFKNTRTGFYRRPAELQLKIGDIVAVEASPGHDIGRVLMVGPLVYRQMKKCGHRDTELKKVFRIARQQDIEKFEEARAREHDTMIKSRKIAEDLGLDMKIGDVEYQGDGGKAIFYYIADERVDFRKLIRVLADTFKVRIEMKQIGARQEAGRIGGIGPCGRPLCCSSWMNRFVSVGTGAARLQDLSMNPQKLAGQCAKLKCCLNYETDAYAEASKQLPPRDVVLQTKDCDYFQFKADILARKISYSTDKNMPVNLVTIDAMRAFEIIALNKQGIKVDSLTGEEDVEKPREYIDLTDQDSLTRFDKSKRQKRRERREGNANTDKKSAAQPAKQPASADQPKQSPKQAQRSQKQGQPKPKQAQPKQPKPQQQAQPQQPKQPKPQHQHQGQPKQHQQGQQGQGQQGQQGQQKQGQQRRRRPPKRSAEE